MGQGLLKLFIILLHDIRPSLQTLQDILYCRSERAAEVFVVDIHGNQMGLLRYLISYIIISYILTLIVFSIDNMFDNYSFYLPQLW